jgi:hypothetical protein
MEEIMRTLCIAVFLASAMLIRVTPATANVNYQFCVSQTSQATGNQNFGVQYTFGPVDIGKEAARVIVSQKYKQADTESVTVSDYNPHNCGKIRDEANVTMTADQIKQLGDALAAGDIVKTATTVVEIATGIQVRQVQDAGKAAQGAAHWVGCRVGIGC